jgi:AraC-like DNA-binding protein
VEIWIINGLLRAKKYPCIYCTSSYGTEKRPERKSDAVTEIAQGPKARCLMLRNEDNARMNGPIAGIGRVLLWSGGSLWIGRAAGSVHAHAHHAIQVSLALSGQVRLCGEREPWSDYSGALVHPHQRHQFDGGGHSVAQLFVEPETWQGRALLARHADAGIHRLPEAIVAPVVTLLRSAYEARATDANLGAAGQKPVAMLAGAATQPPDVDARITRVIEWLRSRRGAPVSLTEAAGVAHLSPSRFRHLFMAQTGITFRAYLLWLRIGSAIGAAMGGLSWTAAAQDWGFADSAHLSRTCRRMFGISPTMLVREEGAPAPRR